MGKRKAKKKAETKKKPTLPSTFKCPFCGSSASCEVEMQHKAQLAKIECRVCQEGFQCRMNHLTEPIDVFYEWVDACDANAAAAAQGDGGAATGGAGAGAGAGQGVGLAIARAAEDDGGLADAMGAGADESGK